MIGTVLRGVEADNYRTLLSAVVWRTDSVVTKDKVIETTRQVAWHVDRPFRHTHSDMLRKAMKGIFRF
jgi:hypothetical protein